MELEVKTLKEDGSIVFEGVLGRKELTFVIGVGLNVILASGASPFVADDEADIAPSTTTKQ